jgi:DNA-binding MarR family transcriptional regulator
MSDEKVKRFFEEHPIHSFSIEAIAEYLTLTEPEVNRALNHLILDDFVDAKFQLAHPEKLDLKPRSTEEEK